MAEKQLSEEAQWFLKNLQRLQDDFADSIGAQIVTTDRNGNLITKMSGQQRICQIIQKTEKGKKGCADAYHAAVGLVKKIKESVFMDCHAGLASLWVPIKTKSGEIVGSITGCGGRYDRGESKEEIRKKFIELADKLGITEDVHPREDYLKALEEVKVITESEMKKRAERLAKLVGILAEESALGEAFEIEGKEW
ncbi:PocR ligand-binding domain-containing protein [bacterium]|nr:PocR ligand-binding domain-containing protein [bacterium]